MDGSESLCLSFGGQYSIHLSYGRTQGGNDNPVCVRSPRFQWFALIYKAFKPSLEHKTNDLTVDVWVLKALQDVYRGLLFGELSPL